MNGHSYKERLLDLLRRSYGYRRALAERLSDEERVATGTPERWSFKDHLAHLAVWMGINTERLAMGDRGETPPAYDDLDRVNAQIFEANRHRSWAEVLAESDRRFAGFVAQVATYSDEELTDPERLAWPGENQLGARILRAGFWHPLIHLSQYFVERGDVVRGNEVQESLAAMLGGDEWPAEVRATARYNLACFYALSGQADKALAALRDALGLNPGLAEWSREDPDLVSLHGHPAYQALYA